MLQAVSAGVTWASKKLMKIEAYHDSTYSVPYYVGSCTVQINPASYTHEHEVSYNDQQPLGTPGTTLWFKGIPPQKVSFDIYFDATVGSSTLSKSVADRIAEFKKICFNYNGAIHEPNYLILSWGTLAFKCKLTSLSISYTLFKSSGTPLRAKLSVSFKEALDANRIAKEANNQSPDLTHYIQVKEGDTLPLLCHKVYGDSRYYMEVAAYNNILNFRALKPGMELYLPPIR